MLVLFLSSSMSKIGKSALGSVASEYFPELVSILRFSPSKNTCISLRSGKSLHNSLSFLAGAVVWPPLLKFVIVESVSISDSRSVAFSFTDASSTDIKTFESIGSVCLFSTTPSVALSDLTISSFVI